MFPWTQSIAVRTHTQEIEMQNQIQSRQCWSSSPEVDSWETQEVLLVRPQCAHLPYCLQLTTTDYSISNCYLTYMSRFIYLTENLENLQMAISLYLVMSS